jgi:hypothetical protein
MSRLDPKTSALEAYISASVERLLQGHTEPPQNGLIFLSAWQEAMPAMIHLDPVLEPVDSRVFAVLWLWAKQQGRGSVAFPTYDYLLDRCNIHSKATLARSIAILRLSRWITLCRRVREQGRYRGSVYALHDEPLALIATEHLDPDYRAFVGQAIRHSHARVGKVASVILESLPEQDAGLQRSGSRHAVTPISARIEAMATLDGTPVGRYFGLRRTALGTLKAKRCPHPLPADRSSAPNEHQVQKLNSVNRVLPDQVQNLNLVPRSSSSSKNNKTTTTTGDAPENRAQEGSTIVANLAFHDTLTRRERQLARGYLRGLAVDMQQALLDELAEKMDVQAKQACRVRNPLALLSWMCQEVKAGRPPLTSAHLHRRERRDRQCAVDAHIKAEQEQLTAMALAGCTLPTRRL